jgi:uncharacterized protein (DUF2141 family)
MSVMDFRGLRRSMARFSAISVVGVALAAGSGARETVRLEVVVTGIEELEGDVAIAVFANQVDFDARENAVASAFVPVNSSSVVWSTDVAATSEYAILVYHDVNGNGEIDFRLIGVPKEPYGFSNDARRVFGPPEYDKARIQVQREPVRFEIEIH